MCVYTEGMIPCLSLPKQLIQTKIEFFQVINHNTLFPEKDKLNIFFLSKFFLQLAFLNDFLSYQVILWEGFQTHLCRSRGEQSSDF